MNILPKKSWHVRNKDNVARVRKDEAQAAEEERVRRKRAELAEQEARTDFLRKKARLSLPDASGRTSVVEVRQDTGHVNFFQDVEEGKGTNRGNKEYEEEKQKEKERQEKALGILTYLGQSASEAQTCRPWYQEAPSRTRKEADDTIKDEKLKGKLDPMNEVEKYLQKKTGEKRKYSERNEHKKTKERRNEERRASTPSIEQLRQERLKREAAEKARAKALLSGKKEPPEQEMDDRKRRYNSQFNPQLARKPKVREEQWRLWN